MTTALSVADFYAGTYDSPLAWAPVDRGNVAFDTQEDAAWPVDRHEVTFEVSGRTAASAWFQRVLSDLVGLLNLGPNWNGYGEQPVHPASSKRLVRLLDELGYRGRPPALVPLADGGIQAEWHRGEASIEIVVPPTGDSQAWFYGEDGSEDVWTANRGDGLRLLGQRLESLQGV